LSPGLPVWRSALRADRGAGAAGLELFRHEWRANDPLASGDGLGPVFNERSCVACHFQGGVGGAGDNEHNVLSFEAHPTLARRVVNVGLIHHFAVEGTYREDQGTLRDFFRSSRTGPRSTRAARS